MRNIIYLLIIIPFLFTSCEKEEVEEPVVKTTASISGVVKADLDLTEIGYDYAPEGTVIIAKINSSDLCNCGDSIASEDIIFKTTVKSDGSYSINVDANAWVVNVTLLGEDFEYIQKVNDSLMQRKIFKTSGGYTTVVDGLNKIIDINYN